MTVRQRAQRTQSEREAYEWQHRRPEVLSCFPGDHLLEASEFWAREPGVPDELRVDCYRWRDLLAPPDLAATIRSQRADLLARRRAWLEVNL